MSERRQIIRTSAGAVEYTIAVTMYSNVPGVDITMDVAKISLGSASTPGPWRDPDLHSYPTSSSVIMQMLVGTGYFNPDPDDYYVWVKLTDDPEIVPIRAALRVTVL